ncbi:MAG: hypothetical protein WC680_03600 [Sulfuricurvum sp.]|jgi:radical SAM superfamily enzyme YgiQ (UPF0313 family)
MINYSFPLYRPPAEADNIIIQATYGCSHNNCTFCSMYKTKKYQIREIEDIFKEVNILAEMYPDANKIFLADGDALSLATDYLPSSDAVIQSHLDGKLYGIIINLNAISRQVKI